ncbi:MAG TPA: hypothetical protein VII34_01675 [Pyrinomonadaceae bacterium]
MPINYAVAAQVVDLRNDAPTEHDRFLVDTNVWFWASYSRAGVGLPHWLAQKLIDYPDYLKRCVSIGATLHWCGLTLCELAHLIEKTERDIWNDGEHAAGRQESKPKEYRHNAGKRARVVGEVDVAWKAVEALGSALPAPALIDAANTATALAEFKKLPLDGYDLFLFQAARASGVSQIISDDGDFCEVPGIVLFTSNQAVLDAAKAQGRLLVR